MQGRGPEWSILTVTGLKIDVRPGEGTRGLCEVTNQIRRCKLSVVFELCSLGVGWTRRVSEGGRVTLPWWLVSQ